MTTLSSKVILAAEAISRNMHDEMAAASCKAEMDHSLVFFILQQGDSSVSIVSRIS
jgi:hypothetical protein